MDNPQSLIMGGGSYKVNMNGKSWAMSDRIADKEFYCPNCGEEFTKVVDFNKHTLSWSSNYSKYTRLKPVQLKSAPDAEEQIVQCPVCGNEEEISRPQN